jgi:sugar phosphate isomerase/epimerase
MSLNRRRFLAVSAAAVPVSWWAAKYQPLLANPTARWFKIGACEWSLGKSDPSCFQLAKEIGLDGVQVNMGHLRDDMQLRKPAVQKAYLAAAQAVNLEIASLAIAETNQVPLKRDPRAAQWLADSVGVCQALGLKVVLAACFAAGELQMGNTEEIDHFVKVFRDVAPQAERGGVALGIESYLSAEDNLRLLERIGSPAVQVYYDVGNSTDKGRDVCREIRLLGKQICEFHAKDAGFMLGQGRIDFRKVREAIDAIGYSGWFQIEAAHPHGLVADYAADYKYLRSVFPERK